LFQVLRWVVTLLCGTREAARDAGRHLRVKQGRQGEAEAGRLRFELVFKVQQWGIPTFGVGREKQREMLKDIQEKSKADKEQQKQVG
jgi:hypothetical protein